MKTPAEAVASAIGQMDAEYGLPGYFEVAGYGTGELAAVIEDADGVRYDVRVTKREETAV